MGRESLYFFYLRILILYTLTFSFVQAIRRSRRSFLRNCKTHMDLGDVGPYQGLVESLSSLVASIQPDRLSSKVRKRARSLKGILKGVYSGIKELARENVPGLGDFLYKEIGGLGGLSIFRRMDTLFLAARKAEVRAAQHRAPVPQRQFFVPPKGRNKGGSQGKGPVRQRDMSKIICYNCFKTGHMRNNCPDAGSKSPPSAPA